MRFILAAVAMFAVTGAAQASLEDSVVNGTRMCRWLDSLEFTSGKCNVSVKATSVDVKIAAPRSDAADICKTISSKMRGDGVKFDRGWKLRIFNPATGNSQTAECKL